MRQRRGRGCVVRSEGIMSHVAYAPQMDSPPPRRGHTRTMSNVSTDECVPRRCPPRFREDVVRCVRPSRIDALKTPDPFPIPLPRRSQAHEQSPGLVFRRGVGWRAPPPSRPRPKPVRHPRGHHRLGRGGSDGRPRHLAGGDPRDVPAVVRPPLLDSHRRLRPRYPPHGRRPRHRHPHQSRRGPPARLGGGAFRRRRLGPRGKRLPERVRRRDGRRRPVPPRLHHRRRAGFVFRRHQHRRQLLRGWSLLRR